MIASPLSPAKLSLVVALSVAHPAFAKLAQTAGGQDLDALFSLSLKALSEIPVVTATATSQQLIDAPASMTVLTQAQMRALGARTVADALESVAGLHVSVDPLSGTPAFSFRGFHSAIGQRTLIMIDGAPMVATIREPLPVRIRMPIELVKQVEIIRGPAAAVHGASAFGGVINIITLTADEIAGVHLGSGAGSYQARSGWAQFGHRTEDWKVAGHVQYDRSGTDSSRKVGSDRQTSLDSRLGTSASLAPASQTNGYTALNTLVTAESGPWQAKVWGAQVRLNGVGVGVAQAVDPQAQLQTEEVLVELNHTRSWLDEALTLKLTGRADYRRTDSRFRLLPPGTTVPIGADGNLFTRPAASCPPPACLVRFPEGIFSEPSAVTKRHELRFALTYTGLSNHSVRVSAGVQHVRATYEQLRNFGPGVIDGRRRVVGGELTDVSGTNFASAPNATRGSLFAQAQDEWQLHRQLYLVAGVRYDRFSDVGAATSPRVAAVYRPTSTLTTKLMYGRGFRAPTFAELSYRNNPTILGNPDLQPEVLDSGETSIIFEPGPTVRFSVSGFVYQARNLIQFVPAESGGLMAQNIAETNAYGGEFEASWEPVESLQLSGNLAVQRARDAETGERTAGAAGHQIFGNLTYRFLPHWQVGSNINYVADRRRDPSDPRASTLRIADYTNLNLVLRGERFWKGLSGGLIVRNALDSDQREPMPGNARGASVPGDFEMGGRSVWLNFDYAL